MVIREAIREDSGAIANVVLLAIGVDIEHLELHTSPFNYDLLKTLAEREDSQYSYKNCYVCEVDGVVAGAICSYDGSMLYELRKALFEELQRRGAKLDKKLTDECESGELYIDSIAVFKEYRGQGIAKALIEKFIKTVKEKETAVIFLEVRASNLGAIMLYEKCGFVFCGIRKDYYTDPKENALLMRLAFDGTQEYEDWDDDEE